MIGHSVGEYAALVASGAVDGPDAVRLVRERGIATAAAAAEHAGRDGGGDRPRRRRGRAACATGSTGVWAANYNCPGQLVVSGTEEGVVALMAAAEAAGARRAIRLKVSGGFHSPLTASAEPQLAAAVAEVEFREPEMPFFSTVTTALEGAAAIPGLLVRQLTTPVRFTQAVERLRDLGVRTFVEIGPGSVLCGPRPANRP